MYYGAMSNMHITLTGVDAQRIERLMRERSFSSPEEAIAAALTALELDQPDAVIDQWLKDVVAARYDASLSDATRTMSLAEARAKVLASD